MTDTRSLERLRTIARLLDARFGIPGTGLRFGLDSLLGLVPGLGDAATALVSLYIVAEAHRLGVRPVTLARMGWNVALDLGLGAVPVLGDLFDFFWKSNLRNIALLERDLARRDRTR
jgi:C4-dicarboxylate transporter